MLPSKNLYGIVGHIYDYILKSIDICLSIKLLYHISFVFFTSHIYKKQQHFHSTCKDHNDMNFYIDGHKLVIYHRDYHIKELLFRIQLVVLVMSFHKDRVEVDYK